MTATRRLLAASVLVATGVTMAGCGGGGHELNSASVQHAIEQTVLAQRGLRTPVSCPSSIPQSAGHTFTCTASLSVGTFAVDVTETDANGHVRYAEQQPLRVLDIVKVEQAIQAAAATQRHVTATVSCPPNVLQAAGVAFRCVAVAHGSTRQYPFAVTEIDGNGHVRYVGT